MECSNIDSFKQCFYFQVYPKKVPEMYFLENKQYSSDYWEGSVHTHTVHTTEKIYTGEDFETTDFPFKGNIDKISNDSLFIYCHVRFTTVHWKTLENMYRVEIHVHSPIFQGQLIEKKIRSITFIVWVLGRIE